jgi:dTMP kinase
MSETKRTTIPPRTYIGRGLPYNNIEGLPGWLIVLEGSDSVGRTTQLQLLRNWLEVKGYGVVETDWTASPLVASTIDLAKEGHTMNVLTFNLLYATDFADRLEHEIIPALKAGFVVLSDRYIYTAFARAIVRGADGEWIRNLFGFALQPDLVLYLKADAKTLVKRALLSTGLDYWEAGLDHNPGMDPYDSFLDYQSKLLKQYDLLAKEFGFVTVDARPAIATVQRNLRRHVQRVLADGLGHRPGDEPPAQDDDLDEELSSAGV